MIADFLRQILTFFVYINYKCLFHASLNCIALFSEYLSIKSPRLLYLLMLIFSASSDLAILPNLIPNSILGQVPGFFITIMQLLNHSSILTLRSNHSPFYYTYLFAKILCKKALKNSCLSAVCA